MNRYLLIEFYTSCGNFQVINTFMKRFLEETVRYFEIVVTAITKISAYYFAELDFVIAPPAFSTCISRLFSTRSIAFASHHFPVISDLDIELSEEPRRNQPLPDFKSLYAPITKQLLNTSLADRLSNNSTDDVSKLAIHFQKAVTEAIATCIPHREARPKRPWISSSTLILITNRQKARDLKDWPREKELSILIRRSAKIDREHWMRNLACSDSWMDIRQLKTKRRHTQGRLKNMNGELVSSEFRAETMATYLERVQWAARPDSIPNL